ncbi:MAG: hypothetical protein U0936_20455 [Planctomycetaceae bacterium]
MTGFVYPGPFLVTGCEIFNDAGAGGRRYDSRKVAAMVLDIVWPNDHRRNIPRRRIG